MNFDSGWEWGYWLNNVITARASWDPIADASDDWEAFGASLDPFCRLLGPSAGPRMKTFLVELTRNQLDMLVYGRVNGEESIYFDKLSGIAYLSGSDTWYDVPRMFGLKFTQPDKVHLDEASSPLFENALVLLREMERVFSIAQAELHAIVEDAVFDRFAQGTCESDRSEEKLGHCSAEHVSTDGGGLKRGRGGGGMDTGRFVKRRSGVAIDLLDEISDAMSLLAMRAKQVRLLYESARVHISQAESALLQGQARGVISQAAEIVEKREQLYRVPWQRIASWRENPTVYRFGYLWAVHSLYYWWRDQGLSEKGSLQSQMSPCYLNRMDASETAVGWGKTALEFLRYLINTYSPFSPGYPLEIINCIAPPSKEYSFPDDLYHHY
jgi:hypothetical protein